MKQESIRFVIVGAGGIAQAYAKAFEHCHSAELVGVADIDKTSAVALAERLGCRFYESHFVMAKEALFDAVIICTPPNTHREITLFFLERGHHVLCEKPFSIDVESA